MYKQERLQRDRSPEAFQALVRNCAREGDAEALKRLYWEAKELPLSRKTCRTAVADAIHTMSLEDFERLFEESEVSFLARHAEDPARIRRAMESLYPHTWGRKVHHFYMTYSNAVGQWWFFVRQVPEVKTRKEFLELWFEKKARGTRAMDTRRFDRVEFSLGEDGSLERVVGKRKKYPDFVLPLRQALFGLPYILCGVCAKTDSRSSYDTMALFTDCKVCKSRGRWG